MNGLSERGTMRVALVIGVHSEELAFGSQVAWKLDSSVHVVRITNGLSHEKSLYQSGFYYSAAHQEMYLQIHQQLKGKIDLVIDLHTGINDSGRCADILSADTRLLRCMQTTLAAIIDHPFSPPDEERLYRITSSDERRTEDAPLFPVCHTIIPEQVWNNREYIYAGLEIYLHEPGKGTAGDCDYAFQLIHLLSSCAEQTTRQ